MFLRSNTRIKDGKRHRYYTVVESRRLQSGKVAQRQVLYLGEINDSRQAAWRRTPEVFDEARQQITPLSLFPEDRPVPADAIDSVQVKLGEMKLESERGPTATAGWAANCGDSCNWIGSGRGNCRRGGKVWRGRRCWNCWW
jgi:hypothetical protein